MFRKLKSRLVLLYGLTSSIILTTIVAGVFLLNFKQNQDQIRLLFEKNMEQIIEKIRTDNVVSSSWLSKMHLENHILIFIDSNGRSLTDIKHSKTLPDLDTLLNRIKNKSEESGIYLDRKQPLNTMKKTPVYSLSNRSPYISLGMAAIISDKENWVTIRGIYYDTYGIYNFVRQIILFTFIDLIGVAAFFLISSLYIGKILTPLEEGQKKQNAFVAAASHELRSPLTVIKAGILSIKEDITKTEQFLPHIEGECNRMTRLISDMLLLASSDSKSWSLNKEPVDMDTLLIESYDMFCTCGNNKNLNLTLELSDQNLKKVYGDKERIKQILTILVNNAMDYTPPNGTIVIRAYNQKHYVTVEIEDHGPGISLKDKKLVFERFYRGDESRNDKKHFGLGLSIARELVELHGGDISLKDTAGGGATFMFRLLC
ncbi:sensor histidine kinase [Anaerocolumna sp. MB42-C2]|uniref:sensor histidine kinase n=1 Tax=Anaerocolumna sp. MB42-C2 TaxID=3070997 RepID=UPI0027E16B8F|nr:HAMP domain-containing sensor histidine kinase [Anaerocolumna sp. MB42-C2]WMJ85713.1 HAMP domain-containing sensor histidine kinase [Anaerocolumna sp. MB42-C2]